jgi:hypothetical protein
MAATIRFETVARLSGAADRQVQRSLGYVCQEKRKHTLLHAWISKDQGCSAGAASWVGQPWTPAAGLNSLRLPMLTHCVFVCFLYNSALNGIMDYILPELSKQTMPGGQAATRSLCALRGAVCFARHRTLHHQHSVTIQDATRRKV